MPAYALLCDESTRHHHLLKVLGLGHPGSQPCAVHHFAERVPTGIPVRAAHKRQLIDTFGLLPSLWMQRYDMVIDLQNNLISRLVRRSLFPKAWVEFDKYLPRPAGERNRLTIEAAGLGANGLTAQFTLRDAHKGKSLLQKKEWNTKDMLVVINPAGFFETRNWPLDNYVRFGELWLQHFPNSIFLLWELRLSQTRLPS